VIEVILLIVGTIMTIMMINAAFRLGNRIADAAEATALSTAALYHALSPEAKARADAALGAKAQAIEERAAARGQRYGVGLAIIAAVVLLALLIGGFGRARADERRSFYDRNGSFAGSTTTYDNGKRTSAYDRNGRFDDNAIRNSDGTTSFYDRNGHFVGSAGRR
jgi:hypothetical protein